MGLEDVAVLLEVLVASGALARDPRPALRAWEVRRAPRVRWVQDQSRRLGRVAQWEGRAACALRDGLARLLPDAGAERALVRMAEQPI